MAGRDQQSQRYITPLLVNGQAGAAPEIVRNKLEKCRPVEIPSCPEPVPRSANEKAGIFAWPRHLSEGVFFRSIKLTSTLQSSAISRNLQPTRRGIGGALSG